MNTTHTLLAIALVAAAALAAVPTAAADTAPECLLREGHNPVHCVPDCTPLGESLLSPDTDTPLRCHED